MRFSRVSDVMLAGLIIMVLALMIVPLSEGMVDLLIATNLTISVIMMMMSLYISGVLAFSSFPSLLLFTTLFRMALSISTTRMILLHASAGKIIFTFGQFVVGGNFVVGAVIFLIIIVVNFLVITKGSERVAEVGARFTLDAMPGKQMSIDADMRAGTIDVEEGKRRRSNLEKENQLYGAMDGAMKFVKGDAICSLIITAINIIAGLIIGVSQKGMPMEKALKVYSILTIGDGLVSQIPAIMISITAGIIVTRVSSEDKMPLGKEIFNQVINQPKAMMLAGSIALLFALLPGFPKPAFLTLGGTIFIAGRTFTNLASGKSRKRRKKAAKPGVKGDAEATMPEKTEEKEEPFSVTVPLMLDVATSIESSIEAETLNEQLMQVRRALYHDLGVPFPGIHLRFNENLASGSYQILLQEVPISQGKLVAKSVIVRESKENLNILGIPFQEETPFLPNVLALWVAEKHIPQLEKAGVKFLRTPEIFTYHLSFVLKRYAGDFIGLQETRFLTEQFEKSSPEIVREVMRILPVQKITEVLQRLVQEEISIRNLKSILQALIDWGQKEKEPVLLADYVRTTMKRYISYKFSGGQNILAAYLLDPTIEDTIRKAIRQTSAGSYLALEPDMAKRILRGIKQEVGDLSRLEQKPVLLTSMDIRRYVRKLIELDLYELPVLSHQELTEEITIQPLGRIVLPRG
ncbi:MAG: type III secretion system export apparatus subunit SctV [Puniceicoccales bacterium]|jgi:type III secretion protein V|nr:type III secretion system export apparatus subunit SctV [Puniceicoccales bacterium]